MPYKPGIYVKCSVGECRGNSKANGTAKGLCQMHYARWKRLGSTDDSVVESPIERFWKMTDLVNGPVHIVHGKCWVWTGCNVRGYGKIKVGDEMVTATRFIWEFHFGPIESGLCVLHRCDNPSCVNLGHLFLGTDQDNKDDRRAKGRTTATGRMKPRFIDRS